MYWWLDCMPQGARVVITLKTPAGVCGKVMCLEFAALFLKAQLPHCWVSPAKWIETLAGDVAEVRTK
jgi:hypothetical protein